MLPRCLFGPIANATASLPTLPAHAPWLTFGRQGSTVSVKAADTWEAICRRLPAGWQPEAVIVVFGEEAIPIGVWSAPVPVIALALDWTLRWHFFRKVLNRCDLVLCDRATAYKLTSLGIGHIHIPTRWDDGPTPLDPAPSAITRDLDLLFIGDLHPAAQRETLPWLGRLARLSARRHVLLQPVREPHNPQELLSRARIFFHNGHDVAALQRLWAAAAAGALPFVPADDAASGSLWRDRHNCIRYSADNLEALLEHYLESEQERQHLAEASRKTAHSLDTMGLWAELASVLEHDGTTVAEALRAARAGTSTTSCWRGHGRLWGGAGHRMIHWLPIWLLPQMPLRAK